MTRKYIYEDPKALTYNLVIIYAKDEKPLSIIVFMFTFCATVHQLFYDKNESK